MKENLSQASIEPLLNYFEELILLNKEEKGLVTQFFHARLYRKRQYALQEGNAVSYTHLTLPTILLV